MRQLMGLFAAFVVWISLSAYGQAQGIQRDKADKTATTAKNGAKPQTSNSNSNSNKDNSDPRKDKDLNGAHQTTQQKSDTTSKQTPKLGKSDVKSTQKGKH